MIVGLVSDTHGLVRPEALEALSRSDLIVHAGDIGGAQVIEALETLGPVVAVRGNVDEPVYLRASRRNRLDPDWAAGIPTRADMVVEDTSIHVVHDLATLDPTVSADVVVVGHSHIPKVGRVGSMLVVNPGSAGPRRFRLPGSIGMMTVVDGDVSVELIELEP
ncbi:MAG TPA: metallophosphoesterase family protein [Acidimicrobiia bacterium]|nr:metallophosphoesterase family protein [Acidimicrobiia bacterium]